MYKALVNNQIVNMRKEVKKSQRHVIQTIHKQLKSNQNLLDKAKEKENEKLVMKFNERGEKLAEDVKIAKGIKPDEVSKMALITKDYSKEFETREQRIKIMIAKHSYVQKMVTAFRNENQDWESWMETIIELWHEKKEIRSGVKTKEKDRKKGTTLSLKPIKKNIDCNGDDSNESKAGGRNNDSEDDDKDLNNEFENVDNDSDDIDNGPEENVEEEVDDFFLGSKIKQKIIKRTLNEEDGNEETLPDQRFRSEGRHKGRFGADKRFKDVNSNHIPLGSKPKLKTMDSKSQNFEFRNTESKNAEFRNAEFRNPETQNRSNSNAEAKSIHPSWQAKQREKRLIASSLSIPMKAKHIKFDE